MKLTNPKKTPIPLLKAMTQPPQGLVRSWCQLVLALMVAVWALAGTAQAQGSYSLVSLFSVPQGTGNIVSSANDRGLAYDAVSNLVYVSSSGGSIGAYNGTNGSYLGTFSLSGVGGGTFAVDQVGVADDGAIYSLNLTTTSATVTNRLYRWSSWNATPTVAFVGNPLTNCGSSSLSYINGRIGDTMAVTGSGANTRILAGVAAKPYFSLFYTTDGLNFTNTIIDLPTGFNIAANIYGISFYTNNTFLVKPYSSTNNTVYLVQYPANYASQTVVTGVVLSSSSLGGAYNNTTMLSYAPSAGFLGVVTPSTATNGTTQVGVLNGTNIAGGTAAITTTTLSTTYANGNGTGGTALGGNGKTNVLYVLCTGNALQAYSLVLSSAPLITGFTGGITNAFPPQTLTVTSGGSTPLSYHWYQISGSTTNAITDTNNSYTATTGGTNLYFVVVTNAYGSATSSVVGLSLYLPVTNSVVSQNWKIAPGASGYSFLPASGDSTRGMGYDTNSQRLVVATTGGSFYILDGNTGTNIGTLSTSGLPLTGQFAADQVGIADDGAVYAVNLVIGNSQTALLYRWSSPSNSVTPTVAYNDSGASILYNDGNRWGDTMAIRGGGANTQIILGSRAGTNVAIYTTPDGINYTPSIIAITNVTAGFAQNGIAFGAGNTFWVKSVLGHLYEISYDPAGQVGGVVLDYPNPSKVPSYQIGVAVDPVNNILAGVDTSDVNHDLKLYQLTGTSDAPVLFSQSFFAAANVNGNYFAPIVLKYPRAFAMDVNNGLQAVTYGVPATTAPTITVAPASQTVFTNIALLQFNVSASGSIPLYYQWQFSTSTNPAGFANITGATGSSYSLTNPPLSKAGYYQVVVHNVGGYATSTPPALLTLLVPTTSLVVTQLWTVPPGIYSFLDSSTYALRGLAYDTNTGTLLLADHTTIHAFSGATGSYLGDLSSAGLPTGGNWVLDQIGVADDGIMYSCNLSLTGPGFDIIQWTSLSVGASGSGYAFGGSTGADPSGTGDRWGDTMSVRGSGVNTEIIIGSYNGTSAVVFDTTDGATFTPHVISVTGAPLGFSGLGIAFGAGNTFWAKGGHNYNLREVSYDKVAGTGTIINTFTAGTQVPNDLTGLSVDVTNNILGGVGFNDAPNDFQLYLLSGNTNAPSLFNQAFFGSSYANSQENAASVLVGGLGFALDVNNGITAISYGMPSAPAVKITSVAYAPGAVTLNWNNTFDNHTYQVRYKNNLPDTSWTSIGSPITATDATASYVDTTAGGSSRFYRVISQ